MPHITEGDNQQSVEILQEQVTNQKQQINIKDEQIERLQSALDQSQQLQALAESRHQAEHQQLAQMRSRSVLQRLRAVFVAFFTRGKGRSFAAGKEGPCLALVRGEIVSRYYFLRRS